MSGKNTVVLAPRSVANAPKHINVVHSRPRLWIPVLLTIIGIGVLLYPVVATNFNNYVQHRHTLTYSEQIEQSRPEVLDEMLAKAEEYNRSIPGTPVLDPWMARVSKNNYPYQGYLHQLDLLPEMGRLIIPKARVDLPIYHGSEVETLERGIGHLYGSSLPVGGNDTHAVLTGHTGLPTATLLDHLVDVEKGDLMFLNVMGRKMAYRVYDIRVVKPDEIKTLKVQGGRDLLTVLTCTPYGINSHRLLVTGERTTLPPEDFPAAQAPLQTLSWWMWVLVAIATAAGVLAIVWVWGQLRRRRNENFKGDAPRETEKTREMKSWKRN
ncbi:class C sortase [Mobiluncus curtisii]|uniref:class C sortase n=1 Tax=Mobiluncus curtisii TaxID=2051 RepID=UPI001470396E|nr:class C sortase [Mobiluncus curtisii]